MSSLPPGFSTASPRMENCHGTLHTAGIQGTRREGLCPQLLLLWYIKVYCTVLCCTVLHCETLHCTMLHCATLNCTALHCIALHCTALYCTVLHCTAVHCTALCGWAGPVCHHFCLLQGSVLSPHTLDLTHLNSTQLMINRPGVAGVVLQTPSSLCN